MTTPNSGNTRLKVLYLDIEGGFGGSSRSLYHLIAALDREAVEPFVLLRKQGPIAARYKDLGVAHAVAPVPAFTPSERKNAVSYVLYLNSLRRMPEVRRLVERSAGRISLIHANHEGLGPAANRLARVFGVPWVCHVRTRMQKSCWSKKLYRVINAGAARIVFITGNEEKHFSGVLGREYRPEKGIVVHNCAPPAADENSEPMFPREPGLFRLLSLSNYSENRGTDLIAEVAAALAGIGRRDFRFHLCGRPAGGGVGPWKRDFGEVMREKIDGLGVADMVTMEGHVPEPERALASVDALIQVRRRANPWGREIMEAMSHGLPVVAVGSYQGFIEEGKGGILTPEFDAGVLARALVRLKDDPEEASAMGRYNRDKARAMFDCAECARKMTAIYREALA